MSSYHFNAPRQYTPSVFRSNKQSSCPIPALPSDEPIPDVNPCHQQYRQLRATHPYTFSKLREAESQRATRDVAAAEASAASRAAEAATAQRHQSYGSGVTLQ